MHARLVTIILFVAAVLISGDVLAIDGNYASPYAIQADGRSQIAALPTETLFAALLLILNLMATVLLAISGRKRKPAPS